MELSRHESPSRRWQGYILTKGYLTFPVLARWEKVVNSIGGAEEQNLQKMVDHVLPFMIEFVDEWHLDSLPEKMTIADLPGDPQLLSWLVDTINVIFENTTTIDETLPKESSNTSDTTSPPQES